MIEFKMSADVVERLKRHSADQKNIVLDFDDGVGPYSAVGAAPLMVGSNSCWWLMKLVGMITNPFWIRRLAKFG
nr:iron-sulfur cluster biosynthesis family protein [Secundilactobacillus oryzae]